MNKKDIVIAVLATFCLTATLFMIFPTRSNPGIGEYDAWNDLNGDGSIDIYDAISLAGTYGTSGDPTKNVNVTNLPIMQPEPAYRIITTPVINMSWTQGQSWITFSTYVGGFSRAFVLIAPVPGEVYGGTYTVNLWLGDARWCYDQSGDFLGYESWAYNSAKVLSGALVENGRFSGIWSSSWSEDSYLGVKAPYVELGVSANSTVSIGWMNVRVVIYLRNE